MFDRQYPIHTTFLSVECILSIEIYHICGKKPLRYQNVMARYKTPFHFLFLKSRQQEDSIPTMDENRGCSHHRGMTRKTVTSRCRVTVYGRHRVNLFLPKFFLKKYLKNLEY